MSALVDIEIYAPNGTKVHQRYFDNQPFAAGQRRTYTVSWAVPSGSAPGAYTVKIGVFGAGWRTLYAWNNGAATVTVR